MAARHYEHEKAMTFRHIECALAVARAGSINSAAAELLVSQPYLSGIIGALEKELGYRLFVRSTQGISLTEQGEIFMSYAGRIMDNLAEIQAIGGDSKAPLSVATYYSRFVTQTFMDFHIRHDESVNDRYREMGNMEIIEALAAREFSLGIIYHAKTKQDKFLSLAEDSGLEYHSLFDNMGTYLIMSDTHPLASKDRITHDDLLKCSFAFFDDSSTVLYMLDHLKLHESSRHLGVSDRAGFMDALLSGNYLSVINTPYPDAEKMFTLKDIGDCMPDDADIDVGSGYLIRKDHRLTTRERAFLQSLQHK